MSDSMTARPMLEGLHISNYGCIADATIQLSPLHALVGPNDSGKSTVLRALRTMSWLASGQSTNPARLLGDLGTFLQENSAKAPVFLEAHHGNLGWGVKIEGGAMSEVLRSRVDASHPWSNHTNVHPFGGASRLLRDSGELTAPLRQALNDSWLVRLDPDALRQPSQLIPEGQPMRLLDDRGSGLPGLYDAIASRDIGSFNEINEGFKKLFPAAKSIRLLNHTSSQKSVGVMLHSGVFVNAERMSEGMLYWLAFMALKYIDPVAILLIEEPENGLHPSRIEEVVSVLRDISQTSQVVMATHSPLVINALKGDEVTVVTREPAQGTQATLLEKTFNYKTRAKIYENGELWVSYANGRDEASLLKAPTAD